MTCPSNCKTCAFSLKGASILVLKKDLSAAQLSTLTDADFSLVCTVCDSEFVLSVDLSGCDACGSGCGMCIYGNNISLSLSLTLINFFQVMRQCSLTLTKMI